MTEISNAVCARTDAPTLYFSPGSCSLASHACLLEAKAEFKANAVLLARGEQRSAAYLAVTPKGRVPALAVDGQVITETIAILSYIAARYPAAGLLPAEDPRELARAYELMSWYASTLHVAVAQVWRTERFVADETLWPALREHAVGELWRGFQEIDRLCAVGPWMLGPKFSVLDPYTLVFWRWGERLGFDMPALGGWAAHGQRTMQRASVRAALEAEQNALSSAAA